MLNDELLQPGDLLLPESTSCNGSSSSRSPLSPVMANNDGTLDPTSSTSTVINKKSAAISSGMESSLFDRKRTKQKRNRSGSGVVSSVQPNNTSSPRDYAYFEDSGTFHLNPLQPQDAHNKVFQTLNNNKDDTTTNESALVSFYCGMPTEYDYDDSDDDESAPPHAGPHSSSSSETQSGIFGVCANLANSIVGGGIVGMPYALKLCGFVTGLYLLIVTAVLADKSLKIIVDMASFHPRLKGENIQTYETLASYPFGQFGEKCVLYATFFMAYGALVSFLIIIKDTLPVALGLNVHAHEWIPELVLLVVALLVILPLSLQRDLSSLSFTSVLSVVSVISLLGFVMWYSPVSRTVADNGGYYNIVTTDMIKPSFIMGMGIFSDGFACQHAAFVLSGSLRKLTRRRWRIVSASGIGFTCVMFICMGVVGFFGFYDDTESDILNNFDAGGFFGKAARFLLAVSMCFTYPLEAFVCRHVLTQIIYGEAEEENREYLHADNKKQRQRITLLVFTITMIPGLVLDDLGIILALTGTIGATSMAYIGPGLIYLGVFGEEFLLLVSRAFADVVTIFHRGKCIDCTDLRSGSPTQANETFPRPLNDHRRSVTRIDNFLEIQLRQDASGEASPTFYYRWVKGNVVSGWGDNIMWFILGMPLWCWVASEGKWGMDERLRQSASQNKKKKIQPTVVTKLANPKPRDFVVAIVFVIYGTMSLIGGIIFIFLYGARDTL